VSPLDARFCHYLKVLGSPHCRTSRCANEDRTDRLRRFGLSFPVSSGDRFFADHSVAKLVDDSKTAVRTVQVKKSLDDLLAQLSEVRTTDTASTSTRIRATDATLQCAQDVAQRICDDARGLTIKHRGKEVGPITVSISISAFPMHSADVSTLLQTADQALYRAKSAGRDQVVLAAEQAV
jgi:Diguanylate cyclase, GGDEF domain